MKVVMDAFGGDNAPQEVVKAAVMATKVYEDIEIILCGDKDKIQDCLKQNNYLGNKIIIEHASEVISNDESPAVAIKTKTDSSLVRAYDILKQNDDVIGLISGGSTGAVLTGAFLKIGRIPGISRPSLSPVMPTLSGGNVLLIDAGANVDCKAIHLSHFAIMGSAYMKCVNNVDSPKVALLNVGTEEHKGNELTKECFENFKKLPINFVGNMEARDFLSGNYDVVVADGFYGNVLLKSVEGTLGFTMKTVIKEMTSSLRGKIGMLFLKKKFMGLKDKLNYSKYGGSPLLGVKKLVVKNHGSSGADSFFKSIEQVINMHNNKLIETVSQKLAESFKEES